MSVHEPIPPEAFLASYPENIQRAADRLRSLVRAAVPAASERVRFGWRLIGYELPVGRRMRYFAYVAPEVAHVHLGFEYGAWMEDPKQLLKGAHLGLRQVRYLTFGPRQRIPAGDVVDLVVEAGRVARMSRGDRVALELERGLHR